jgi:hypothetical protein
LLVEQLELYFIKNTNSPVFQKYRTLIENIKQEIVNIKKDDTLVYHPFTFIGSIDKGLEVNKFKKVGFPIVFMQHGSYLMENIFLKFNEIHPACVNFVFNDYTKQLFNENGAENAITVGSLDLNYPIIKKKKKYDFLYITYCTSYAGRKSYIGSETNDISMDGNNIFTRHKKIIELFAHKFKDKSICIKVQPGIMTGNLLYIPLLDLSKKFKNITIEFSTPISKLIQKSDYIISDYFSSDFINRELHYKKDIFLFNSYPLPLPSNVLSDMSKMFILVSSELELAEKIDNINNLVKNRKRYDDIIEFYSSKNCDSKKIVLETLQDSTH